MASVGGLGGREQVATEQSRESIYSTYLGSSHEKFYILKVAALFEITYVHSRPDLYFYVPLLCAKYLVAPFTFLKKEKEQILELKVINSVLGEK